MYMSCACLDPTANNLDNVCELIFPIMYKHIILAMAITHDESLQAIRMHTHIDQKW